jgi:hypothetical protein
MADTILHCFDPGSAEAEGKIVGSLLAGYGELELEMALCLIAATGNYDASLKALYSVRGEEKRIKKADRMMKVQYVNAKLAIDYKQTISDMQWCRKIRNQYAHCQWYYTPVDGLCFVDLEASSLLSIPIANIENHKVRADIQLLQHQMDFFVYVRKRFWYLAEACQRYIATQKPGARPSSSIHAIPLTVVRPPLHN